MSSRGPGRRRNSPRGGTGWIRGRHRDPGPGEESTEEEREVERIRLWIDFDTDTEKWALIETFQTATSALGERQSP